MTQKTIETISSLRPSYGVEHKTISKHVVNRLTMANTMVVEVNTSQENKYMKKE